MKLGLVSAIADTMNFEEMIDLVAESGLECVEVACWPAGKAERRYAGVSHIDADKVLADDAYAKHIVEYAAGKMCRFPPWPTTPTRWTAIWRSVPLLWSISKSWCRRPPNWAWTW